MPKKPTYEELEQRVKKLEQVEFERKQAEEALQERTHELEERINKQVVTPSSSYSDAREIKRDGRFVAYDNGTVKDTKTGLMWASKDNGKDIKWKDAKWYCENYRGGGYADWRMPTQDELAGLYDKSESYQDKQQSCDVHLTKLIQFTNYCLWASETRGSEAAFFHFYDGGRYWFRQYVSYFQRALPVRGGK